MKFSLMTAAAVIILALAAGGCTNPTGQAGQISYFTEGVITDIEIIDIKKNKFNAAATTGAGAIAGAAAGQIIGRDTRSTVIGAGIGAVAGGVGAIFADRGEGMRLTVNTENGLILLDQPYSCLFQIDAKIRMIKHSDGIQVQVWDGEHYRTAEAGLSSECPVN